MRCAILVFHFCFFFFKQKTAYEMRISDWSSDVCSSDLWVLSSHSLAVLVLAKVSAHWLCSGLALVVLAPFLALMLGLPAHCLPALVLSQIGRASCRERVCQYV